VDARVAQHAQHAHVVGGVAGFLEDCARSCHDDGVGGDDDGGVGGGHGRELGG
jgi:hypothetical protein